MPKLYPLESNQATLINIFDLTEALPKRPYCSDNLSTGIYPRLQRIAITKRYIQLNPPQTQHWLVFDIDRPNSAYTWYDANLPPPFAVVVNKSNTHCHIIYRLESPVCTSEYAHLKPLKYLAAIQSAYTAKLQADVSYSGLIAKNPFSQNHWRVIYCAVNALYGLSELAEWVDITQVPKRNLRASEAVALGRNCALFDSLRKVAYKSIREYRTGKVDTWREYVLNQAIAQNTYSEPLPHSEIKAIAKSVANWVWKHMKQDNPRFTESLKRRQRMRGKKGGIAKGAKNHNKRMVAMVLKEQGFAVSDIAKQLLVDRKTIQRWFK